MQSSTQVQLLFIITLILTVIEGGVKGAMVRQQEDSQGVLIIIFWVENMFKGRG